MRWSARFWLWAAAAVVVVNGFFPMVWILLTSFKPESELTRIPITWWPENFTLQNYVQALTGAPIGRYFLNSLIVAAGATVLCVFVSALAAYALARLRIPHKTLIFSLLVGVSMFPTVTLLLPLFEMVLALGLRNTYIALILPHAALSIPVATLVLVSFFQGIPKDLEAAAMVDGCTRIGALWRVVVPLSAPGVFTASILAFVNSWDEFLLALTLMPSQAMRTLPVGIQFLQGEYTFPWPLISAALVIALVPVALVIAVFQERVVGGLTQGGVKG
ncbi:MAG: carbohydrate ABC transporter permease [Meiothermus sp.]|uniref:carbohydrate ABC transporter permease n=1 Tax=Meiothermus sp. TaxID=1955249 RepID=UPI00260886FB|nr:carbohydrate ABC transporter permease [Meiothermus sp.]MCS7058990.1 carbohydrate ABC transporter permease [Meiothermus sp.]MCX7740926.1 carbohydrate ABC transporter permease [Meiothermus sp.]MDW8091745.1 carbohydrate ABC transporter permease [Meiothermus sp.]MDW8480413.1 carbohydrate ABC transporter permease [Meiothermus sp.]